MPCRPLPVDGRGIVDRAEGTPSPADSDRHPGVAMPLRCRLFIAVTAAALVASMPVAAQTPSLDEVLRRASAYVRAWVPQLANIVSVEVYQQVERAPGNGPVRNLRLKSDVLLVRY